MLTANYLRACSNQTVVFASASYAVYTASAEASFGNSAEEVIQAGAAAATPGSGVTFALPASSATISSGYVAAAEAGTLHRLQVPAPRVSVS